MPIPSAPSSRVHPLQFNKSTNPTRTLPHSHLATCPSHSSMGFSTQFRTKPDVILSLSLLLVAEISTSRTSITKPKSTEATNSSATNKAAYSTPNLHRPLQIQRPPTKSHHMVPLY
ncbi:hypothetical protein E2542_SST10296 [Spatholobus suberectus]|nr:hypothetical protein E2542_SST10296 [Spatholobus suberectus]